MLYKIDLLNKYSDICTLSNCYTWQLNIEIQYSFIFITFSTHPHHQIFSHFKQTLPNKHDLDTLSKRPYYFSP